MYVLDLYSIQYSFTIESGIRSTDPDRYALSPSPAGIISGKVRLTVCSSHRAAQRKKEKEDSTKNQRSKDMTRDNLVV